ncbi:hypothetical protein QQF54_01735 [Lelliottia sp. V106_10]|uniref:hypothetical protein n=1 Tax=Lelliottia wanjuensis TaxID=3050585 RepID=UPI00254E2671|nr:MULTISPECIES: hypothetical protein [unclassified Lelliottia]MDK9354866.1 hypothetical protein [Lelliottia sp. V106_16]MDK9372074.1 hypothetical protein [Lelliottia sp. V106_10]MDK9598710.1 hypothetical protein [Lelliottia sp. V106_5]
MFDLLMKRHGQLLLKDAGWPTHPEWQWQLSYSQGNGCAFYGSLSRDSLLTLLPHLARRQSLSKPETQHLTVLFSLYDITVALKPNALSSHYCHAGCITTVADGFPDDENPAFLTFFRALQADIRDLCALAEQTGYRLLDATTPQSANEVLFSRQTQHFELRAIADMPDATYRYDGTIDETAVEACLVSLLHQHARLLTVRLEIICHTTGDIIAQQWLPETLIETDDKPRHWLSRDAVHELILEAREHISQQLSAWQSFYRAA